MTSNKIWLGAMAILCLALTISCSAKSGTDLATGMKMEEVVSKLKERGMAPQSMAYSREHNAFDLADGRTIVLIGKEVIEKIHVIANPDKGKSLRKTETVDKINI